MAKFIFNEMSNKIACIQDLIHKFLKQPSYNHNRQYQNCWMNRRLGTSELA